MSPATIRGDSDSWFAPFGVRDELELGISPSKRLSKTFVLERGGRAYTDRDRDVLDVLRPHLVSLYERAVERRRCAAAVAALDALPSIGMIGCDGAGNVEVATDSARRLVEAYFGVPLDRALPERLDALIRRQRRRLNGEGGLPKPVGPLLVEGPGRRLVIRVAASGTLLLEEEENLAEAAGLMPREREVLGLVAEGNSNADVAAILWVSPTTVRTHLEHIYAKLGVRSRTAAVARAFPPRAFGSRTGAI